MRDGSVGLAGENACPTVCEFCGEAEGLDRCDWPVMDFVPMRVRDLQVGDLVRRFNLARAVAEAVEEIVDFEGSGRRHLVLRIAGTERRKVLTESGLAAIRIKRATVCGLVCCWRCRAERGDGRVVCSEHWKAWEKVA